MASQKPSNVKNFRRRYHINLGTVIFGLVFIYILGCVILYFTRNRVSIYEVTTGLIVENHTYTGLVLREEQVFSSDSSGYLTYIAREGERVGAATPVYTVTTDGPLNAVFSDSADSAEFVAATDCSQLIGELNGFRAGYDNSTFGDVYTFKSGLNASLLDSLDDRSSAYAELYGVHYAGSSGIVVYSTDGLENITYETFTPDMLNKNNYERAELASREMISQGEPAYKLITDEEWEMIVQIDSSQRNKYIDGDYVEVRFLKDNQTAWAQVSKFEFDGEWYCRFHFTNSMVRYAAERFLEIDVTLDSTSGLKVPNSAIVEKEFYTVPTEYIVKNENGNKIGLYVCTTDKDGKPKQTYTEVTPYNVTDALAYLDMSDFENGTVIVKEGTSDFYTIEKSEKLVGVYNVNKGYADFSLVTVEYRNDDYSIVTPNESYGLTQYDHIVLDGSSVNDEETIYQSQ